MPTSISAPTKPNQSRPPYYVEDVVTGAAFVEGPIPTSSGRHTWHFPDRASAEAFADAMNAAWQCGRRVGKDDEISRQIVRGMTPKAKR